MRLESLHDWFLTKGRTEIRTHRVTEKFVLFMLYDALYIYYNTLYLP